MRRYEANANGTVAMAERYYSMYDDRWRLVGVFRDSVIPSDLDVTIGSTGAADGTLEARRYYVQSWSATGTC
jgi:hypothetical protein